MKIGSVSIYISIRCHCVDLKKRRVDNRTGIRKKNRNKRNKQN